MHQRRAPGADICGFGTPPSTVGSAPLFAQHATTACVTQNISTTALVPSPRMTFFPLNQGGFANASTVSSDADDLLRAMVNTNNRLGEVVARLQPTAAQSSRGTIDRLERAMIKAYHIAVFVRGSYDSRKPDQAELDELLQQAVEAFQDAVDAATAGLENLGGHHQLAIETASPTIELAQEAIVRLKAKTAVDFASFQDRLAVAQKAVGQDLLPTLQRQRQALRLRLCQNEYLSALLPRLVVALEVAQSRSIRLQTLLCQIRDTATRLVSRMRSLKNANKLFRKGEFVLCLLKICKEVLIDPVLVDEVRLVRNELVNEYGGDLPDRIKETVEAVDISMKAIAASPSICPEIRQQM